jgi:hypothetical protein
MFETNVTALLGHFGSGKTELAINGALAAAGRGETVTLADLDVVKPYFRSRSARHILKEAGVGLIAPEGEHVFADLPIIVPQVRDAIRRHHRKVILDIGGDATGARVLGSLSDVLPRADCDVLAVLNFLRPSTPDVAGAVAMIRAIEATARTRITGLVSNTHLLEETTAEIVADGAAKAVETGRELELPVVGAAMFRELADELEGAMPCPILRLERIVKPPFDLQPKARTTGPLFVLN